MFAGKRSTDVSAAAVPTVPAGTLLEHAVKDQLDRGVSLDDVIAKLASSLAASVATQLGISPDAAQAKLAQAFTQALRPTDTGPPRSNAERASSLVSRLRQIAELATGVTNGDTGQSIRLIAGQRSDADQAKAVPAPDPDSILRDALAALAGTASPVPGATPPGSAASAAPAAGSDGRTVALGTPAQAIAAGGDTPLGRILARAVLAGEQPAAPVAAPILGPGSGHLGTAPSGVDTAPAANAASGTAVVDAFVQAFASALARSDAQSAGGSAGAPSSAPADAAAPAAAAPGAAPQPVPSFAIPFAHDAVPVAPPTPAPPLPQAQHVDANAVVDQILRGMAVRTGDGQSEVRMRLDPASLGDVSVRLIVSGGSVDASLTAHTAEAQTALAGGQNQLAKTLADAGLKLQSFTVGLAGGGFADTRDQSRSNDSWNRPNSRRLGGVALDGTGELDETSLFATPSFGPPIYSASSLPGTLNRLA